MVEILGNEMAVISAGQYAYTCVQSPAEQDWWFFSRAFPDLYKQLGRLDVVRVGLDMG